MNERVAALCSGLRQGATLVSVMVPIPCKQLRVTQELDCQFNFGRVELLVHERVADGEECEKCADVCLCAIECSDDDLSEGEGGDFDGCQQLAI